jgi:hypothetical protein
MMGKYKKQTGVVQRFDRWSPDTKDTADKRIQTVEETIEKMSGNHFATRERANDFVRLMRSLPDPDPILQKMGRGITALQELLTDSHLESVWSIRCSAASGAEWFCAAGGDGNGKKEQEAADLFAEELRQLDIPRVIEEMMDAIAFGYAPLEVIWRAQGGRWVIGDIVGKPPQWFEFDQENNLVFRTGVIGTEPLPKNRFLIARHRPSYANPYGIKVFSKCYWPVTFKKNGFRWWTVFVEKYGGAFLYGKYPNNASDIYKNELLTSLERMASDAVAIAPEGAEITIESLANKGSVSNVHAEYIEAANKEISKAVLGQTLTTDIGSKGSYAAAQAHNLVRQDLAAADRRRISACFNRLAAVWTYYNYGADVLPPVFEFVKDEDLQQERAERDTKLYALGWRPKKAYIEREYDIPQEDFEIAHEGEQKAQGDFAFHTGGQTSCSCGCGMQKEKTLFQKAASFFADKQTKRQLKDRQLMNSFNKAMQEKGQDAIDKSIESYVNALGMLDDYQDASKALLTAYKNRSLDDFASCIDNVRFAAIGVAGGKKK